MGYEKKNIEWSVQGKTSCEMKRFMLMLTFCTSKLCPFMYLYKKFYIQNSHQWIIPYGKKAKSSIQGVKKVKQTACDQTIWMQAATKEETSWRSPVRNVRHYGGDRAWTLVGVSKLASECSGLGDTKALRGTEN